MQPPIDGQDRPYLEPPPERKGNGLYCFFHEDRECNSDCMAYAVNPPQGPEYKAQWAQCRLLVGAHQISKHLVIIAQVVKAKIDDDNRKGNAP